MKYFQVVNPNDLQVINPSTNWMLVNGELFTEKEFNNLNLPEISNYFDSSDCVHKSIETSKLFKVIELSKFDTHFFFGCRFKD